MIIYGISFESVAIRVGGLSAGVNSVWLKVY